MKLDACVAYSHDTFNDKVPDVGDDDLNGCRLGSQGATIYGP